MPKNEETEVVKWYTRARRFPQLIGKTHDGTPLWGGPYTYTQVIVGVGILIVGVKTTSLWAPFGLIGNALLLLSVAYGVVLLVGRLPIGSRNPLSVAAGAVRAWSAPGLGRQGGTPVRARRPTRVTRSVLTVTTSCSPTTLEVQDPLPPPATAEPSPAAKVEPPPAVLTGVQRLLATHVAKRS